MVTYSIVSINESYINIMVWLGLIKNCDVSFSDKGVYKSIKRSYDGDFLGCTKKLFGASLIKN